ncbi:MAG: NADH:flavin oxidoreductase/NADH oxidase family protein [Deltaproteobacteria bacterium]|nr:NADH:flavin oxidoreductase/NADH oxidase family protein [Deltaproteobacteria bacterium]
MANQKSSLLAQPYTLPCGAVVKNRMVKSAMSETLGSINHEPQMALVELYRTWAEGGIGLSITGNVMIDHRALGEPGNVVIEDDRHLDLLKKWANAGRAANSHIWVQLNHPGRQSPKGLNAENVSPSATPFSKKLKAFFSTPRELTSDEILDLVNRFGVAAAIVKEAGFTGVQIHGAHGYLVSQFLSPLSNQREDEWGGSPGKRMRFVLEVYRAIREAVGAEFPVGIKLNSADFQRGGFTEEESLQVIRALATAGVDGVEISGGTYEAPAMSKGKRESTRLREAYFIEFAKKVRETTPVPLIVTGGFRTKAGMEAALRGGDLDFIGMARPLAMLPDFPNQLLSGAIDAFATPLRKTGIKAIDRSGVLEIYWYTQQLRRMGHKLEPQLNQNNLWAFIKATLRNRKGVKQTRNLRAR